MKEKKLYTCEICNTDYVDRNSALKCEKSHVKVMEVVKERHLSLSQNGKGYHISVTIKMSDVTEQTYKR